MVATMRIVTTDRTLLARFCPRRSVLACLLALPLAGTVCVADAFAQGTDGVVFVDDIEQKLRGQRTPTQRSKASSRGQAVSQKQMASREALARQQSARANAHRNMSQAIKAQTEKKSWTSKLGFKNPLSGWMGGGESAEPASRPSPRATAQQRAGSKPKQRTLANADPASTSVSRSKNLELRTNGTGNQPRGIFQLGMGSNKPAGERMLEQTARQSSIQADERTTRIAQTEGKKPSWTDRFKMPFARKAPANKAAEQLPVPSYRTDDIAYRATGNKATKRGSEAAVAMISDAKVTDRGQPSPRAAKRSSNVSSAVKLASKQTPAAASPSGSRMASSKLAKAAAQPRQLAGDPLPVVVTPPKVDSQTLVAKQKQLMQKQLMQKQADFAARQKRAATAMARQSEAAVSKADQPLRTSAAQEVLNPHVAKVASKSQPSQWKNPAAAKRAPLTRASMPANPVKLRPIAKPAAKPAAKPQLVVRAKPSEKAVQLLSEANQLSQAAVAEDEYTSIIQLCRHVLAIDNAPAAIEYSHELAGWALNRRGEVKADQGRSKEALLDFEDALRLNPQRWRAIHNRGVLAAKAGRFADAMKDFNRTLELNNRFAKAYSNRATLQVQSGNLEAASEDYRNAIANDPDLAVAHKGRGRVCHMLGQFDLAIQHFDAATMLAPGDARIVNHRGDLLTDMGRYRAASASYQKAIDLDPSLNTAFRNLAWLQATCPDKDCRNAQEAIANASRAIQLCEVPSDLEYDTLAAAQAASGDFDSASAMMDKALELAHDDDKPNYQWRKGLYEKNQPYITEPASAIQQASFAR